MPRERTDIIIQEIKYWKANRLLPGSYCDFLLALYTKGEGTEQSQPYSEKIGLYLRMAIISSLIPISFLVIYFTETAFIMQTVILSIFVIGAGGSVVLIHNKKSIDFYLSLLTSLLLLLLWNIHLLSFWDPNVWQLVVLVILHCFFWYWLGWRLDFRLLKITSLLGVGIAVLSMFLNF